MLMCAPTLLGLIDNKLSWPRGSDPTLQGFEGKLVKEGTTPGSCLAKVFAKAAGSNNVALQQPGE